MHHPPATSVKLEETRQKFGRQPPRGPPGGAINMLRIFFTNIYYPRTMFVNIGLVALFAVPLIARESWYQADARKGSPWDRVLAEREKNA